MDPQTQKLLRLLADEDTESLLDALRDGPKVEADLEDVLGISQSSINRRLHDLDSWGIIEAVGPELRVRPAKRGPQPKEWKLTGDETTRFSNVADAFALELMDLKANRMRRRVEQRRRTQVRKKAG